MKPSHLTTPRTLAETTFVTGYTSGQFKRMDKEDRIVLTGSAIVAAILVIMAIAHLL